MTAEQRTGSPSRIDSARERALADDFDAELRPLIPTALRLAAGMRLDPQDAEDAGGFLVGQLFKVTERQDFPIHGVHAVERLLDADLRFGPNGGAAGGGQPAQ